MDVVSSEPIERSNPLLTAPNCIITPHMAWSSLAARRRIVATTAANVRAFLADRAINVVRLQCRERCPASTLNTLLMIK